MTTPDETKRRLEDTRDWIRETIHRQVEEYAEAFPEEFVPHPNSPRNGLDVLVKFGLQLDDKRKQAQPRAVARPTKWTEAQKQAHNRRVRARKGKR